MKKNAAKPAVDAADQKFVATPRVMVVDIGGTGIKALTLDSGGKPLNDRTRIPTPKQARPKDVVAVIRDLAKVQPGFERVSVGFPGVVKDGLVYTAVNLGKGWKAFDLRQALEHKLKKPVRIANDADIQGLGCVSGRGLELVITLGTGFGSVLFAEGTRVHLELAHHPFHKGKTYEDELGNRALKKKGRKSWNKLLQDAINELQKTFNYDRLYIGGGNSRLVDFKLPPQVKTISNDDGLLGGIALWREPKTRTSKLATASSVVTVKSQNKAIIKSSTPSASAGSSTSKSLRRSAKSHSQASHSWSSKPASSTLVAKTANPSTVKAASALRKLTLAQPSESTSIEASSSMTGNGSPQTPPAHR
jgi:polyphosphate glucokinase